MDESFWIFLSVGGIYGNVTSYYCYCNKALSTMKQLEIEAMKIKKTNMQSEVKTAVK